jgi:hypothetical protein
MGEEARYDGCCGSYRTLVELKNKGPPQPIPADRLFRTIPTHSYENKAFLAVLEPLDRFRW